MVYDDQVLVQQLMLECIF